MRVTVSLQLSDDLSVSKTIPLNYDSRSSNIRHCANKAVERIIEFASINGDIEIDD